MLDNKYTVKPSIVGEIRVYLGSNVAKVLYGNGSYAWNMNSDLYNMRAIKNVKKRLKEDGLEYNKKPYDIKYLPKKPFSSIEYLL